jgi:hypothetical protein
MKAICRLLDWRKFPNPPVISLIYLKLSYLTHLPCLGFYLGLTHAPGLAHDFHVRLQLPSLLMVQEEVS